MDSLTTVAAGDLEAGEEQDGLHVLITAPDMFAACPLPVSGSVLIGRSTSAELQIKDPLASRHHARLRLGEVSTIEDLGSANGTRVRESTIAPHTPVSIAPGEAITIGSTLLILRHSRWSEGSQVLWSHEQFEARLKERCRRAAGSGRSFGLLLMKVKGAVSWPRVLLALARTLPGCPPFAAHGPGEYEAMFPEMDPSALATLVSAVKNDLRAIGLDVVVGTARFPGDGRTEAELLAKAREQLHQGGGRDRTAAASPRPPVRPSAEMQAVYDLAARAAASNINVLVLGETGVGKEVLATWMHQRSGRADKPLVSLNCGALPENLIESELFGHEKGAFTGAAAAQVGLLESGHGGTVFLDEIGEMSLKVQATLLRVLETREVMPVGGRRARSIDVRFVAATHRDLEADCASGRFRQDLYFRLCGISLTIPPLRARVSEIPELIQALLIDAGGDHVQISAPAMELLKGYWWPGNIRELRNVIQRALVLCDGPQILPEHLPGDRFRPGAARTETRAVRAIAPPPRSLTEWQQRERERMIEALNASNWNQSRAAKALGMPRRTFVLRLEQYGLPRPQKGGPSEP